MVQLVQIPVPSCGLATNCPKHLRDSGVGWHTLQSARSWQLGLSDISSFSRSRGRYSIWDSRRCESCSVRCSSCDAPVSGWSWKGSRRRRSFRDLNFECWQPSDCASQGAAKPQRLVCHGGNRVGTRRKWIDVNDRKSRLPIRCSGGACLNSASPCGDKGAARAQSLPHASSWVHISKCIRVAFLVWGIGACIAWVLTTRPVLAADTGSLVVPQVASKAAEFWSRVWPKTLQVISVFREHGLLLSGLLGLSAFFSMAETSITTLWPWKVTWWCLSLIACVGLRYVLSLVW